LRESGRSNHRVMRPCGIDRLLRSKVKHRGPGFARKPIPADRDDPLAVMIEGDTVLQTVATNAELIGLVLDIIAKCKRRDNLLAPQFYHAHYLVVAPRRQ